MLAWMGFAFLVLLGIVLHRFLRLDLTQDWAAALRLPLVLSLLLALGLLLGLARRTVRLRPGLPLLLQWALWGWAGLSRVVSDGTVTLVPFLKDDYTKDIVFTSLLGTLCDSARKFKVLCWVFVPAMIFIAYIAVTQHGGPRKCFHYTLSGGAINYVQVTDNRACSSTDDCYTLPPGEGHLKDEGWGCEFQGAFGLGTVLERVRYVGTLADPNALSLALVMACAMALGLIYWPRRNEDGEEALDEPLTTRQRLVQILLWAGIGVMSLAVLYAASRAAQAALAITFMCFFYQRIGLRGVVLAGTLGAPLMLISNRKAAEAAYSTFTRMQTQLNGYRAFLEQPLFGVGYGNYGRISFITAHNSFLLTATETGIVGSALFVLGVYVVGKFLIQVRRFPVEALDLEGYIPEDGEGGSGALVPRDADSLRESPDPEALTSDRESRPGPAVVEQRVAELRELQHGALVLLSVLVGVGWCVSFLSLSFDVMWLFPVGIMAGYYRAVRDRLPECDFTLHYWEVALALVAGAALPALFAVIATRNLF